MSGVRSSDDESPLEAVAAGAVTTVTLAVGFGLMFAEVPYFWVAFPVGFGGVLPLSIGLVRHYRRKRDAEASASSTETEDALEELRRRYARGELDEETFERRVERLLETESIEDARNYVDRLERDRSNRERVDQRE